MDRDSPMSMGNINFTVTFNEDIDITEGVKVAFGPSAPFDTELITNIWWEDATHWHGEHRIDFDTVNGPVYVSVTGALDLAGNPSVPNTDTGLFIDTKAPLSGVVADSLPEYSTNLTFDVPYTANDPQPGSGIADIELYYQGYDMDVAELYDHYSNGSAITFTASHDGKYLLYTIATDLAGNREERGALDVITVDTFRPYVTDVNLTSPGPYNSPEGIEIRFSEDLRSTGLKVTMGQSAPFDDIVINGQFLKGDHWHSIVPISMDTPSGTYTISITGARDLAGNLLVPHTNTTLDIDTTRPVVTSLTFDRDEPVDEGMVNFTLTFSEEMDSLFAPSVELELDGTTHQISGSWEADGSWKGSLDVTDQIGNGTYSIVVKGGKDLVGNTMQEDASHTITIKKAAPPPPPPPPPTDPDDGLLGEMGWWLILLVALIIGVLLVVLVMYNRKKGAEEQGSRTSEEQGSEEQE
jgi:hypothetical protein